MKKYLFIMLLTIVSSRVQAEDCEKNIIEAVLLDDSSFTMKSGVKYQVDWSQYKVEYADENDIKLWMASDKVLICGNLMINTDSYSQKIAVKRK